VQLALDGGWINLLAISGVIKLSETSVGAAVEAEFQSQLKVNIRNPALGLFTIGFSFFVLALYFAKLGEGGPLVVAGHLKIAKCGTCFC